MEFVTRIWALQIPPKNSGRNMNFLSCFNQTHHLWLMEFEMMALFQIPVTNDVSKHTISYHFGVNSTSSFANDLFSLIIEYSLKYESYYGIVRIKK